MERVQYTVDNALSDKYFPTIILLIVAVIVSLERNIISLLHFVFVSVRQRIPKPLTTRKNYRRFL